MYGAAGSRHFCLPVSVCLQSLWVPSSVCREHFQSKDWASRVMGVLSVSAKIMGLQRTERVLEGDGFGSGEFRSYPKLFGSQVLVTWEQVLCVKVQAEEAPPALSSREHHPSILEAQ